MVMKKEKVPTSVGHCWKIGPISINRKESYACIYVDNYAMYDDTEALYYARLFTASPKLLEALKGVENGVLVRDASKDHEVGNVLKMAQEAIKEASDAS
jgi:hypothetical protein